jgi:hypothetical protein
MRFLASAALALACSSAYAGDIPEGHPDREPLLEASRPIIEHDGADFRVLRLWASDHWAFLCALGQYKDGTLTKLGGNTELFLVVLEKTFGGWQQARGELQFIEDPSTAKDSCRFQGIDTTGELSDVVIQRALKGSEFNNLMWQSGAQGHIAIPEYFFGKPADSVLSLSKYIDVLRKAQHAAPSEVRSAFQYDELLAVGRLARQYAKLGNKAGAAAETKKAVALGRAVYSNPEWSAADLKTLLDEIDPKTRAYYLKELGDAKVTPSKGAR